MRKNYSLLLLAIVFTVNAMAQNIPSYVPKDGLVGYWPFNGNANDESGNGKHGTVNGATLSADRNGVANSAYSFNGVSNFITINNNILNNKIPTSFAISLWVDFDTTKQCEIISNRYGQDCGYNYRLLKLDNKLIFGNHIANPWTWDSCSTELNTTSEWNQITFMYDLNDKRLKLYLNGKFVGANNSNIWFDGNNPTIIGALLGCGQGSFYSKGTFDDIAIYNRALTEQEITALYTSTPVAQNIPSYVPKDGLVGYWPFNGNANDESGNGNNGTVSGATLTADRNGKANSSYSFDGSSSYINIPNSSSLQFNGGLTISTWLNASIIASSISNTGYILSKGADGGTPYSWTSILDDSYCSLQIWNDNNLNTSVDIMQKDYPILTNKWYNVIYTFDGVNAKAYINSQLVKTISSPYSIFSNAYDLKFGRRHTSGNPYFFNGQLDDIAIYNRALTEQEITALYSGTTNLASTKVFVDAPASVNQNDTLELSISTETLNTADNVIAYQTDITYDTTRYTFVSNQTVGTLNPKASVDLNTDKKGTIKVGYISTSALQGAGSLLKLKFKANQKVGQGIFGLSQFMYNNTDITSLKKDTVLTLDVTPPSASISLSQNPVRKGDSLLITVKFSETMTDKPAPQVNLAGANTLANTNLTKVNDFTYTYWWVVEKGNGAVNVEITSAKDLAGNNLSKANSNTTFTVLPTLFGDIDTNKIIRAYDAALALQYSVGLNPLPTMDPLPWSNWRIAVANVDTVGTITANDAALIVKYSIGKITSFPADAKKRGEAPVANITVTQEANQLVFRATGTLYAFNMFMKDNFNAFGQPEVKDKNAMIATNITSTTYNVGLASTTPFTENEPFLILPIVTNENVQGTMDIVANAQEKALAYGAAASIATNQNEAMVIYPNPTKDVVTINNAQGKTVKIVDVQGKEVYNAVLPNAKTEISLKALGAKGMYVVHILDANNLPVQTKHIVLE